MRIGKNTIAAIRYILKSASGEILDQSEDQPFEYLHGSGVMIPGLEKELEGRRAGDTFCAVIEPRDACGLYSKSLILKMKREKFDTPAEISVGMQFAGQGSAGEYRVFRVLAIQERRSACCMRYLGTCVRSIKKINAAP
jgi:FKBP-type peptidyl-prolyl cis-trans isomerase SlyD